MYDIQTMIIKEFCAENCTDLARALDSGANRVELCDNLAVGGTTPSLGVINKAIEIAITSSGQKIPEISFTGSKRSKKSDKIMQFKSIPKVNVMIRPRGGDFFYDEDDLKIMIYDIMAVVNENINGIVFGALRTSDDRNKTELDYDSIDSLVVALLSFEKTSDDFEMVCHMCFDQIHPDKQLDALEWLSKRGFTGVLTHGGQSETNILDNLDRIKEYVDFCDILRKNTDSKLKIIVGGGVTFDNLEEIKQKTGASEFHGTKIVKI